MGRIKSTLIKRTARQLKSESVFDDTFENNKKILGNSMPSKKTRNRIAGYIARLKRAEKDAEKKKAKKAQVIEVQEQF